MSSISTDPVLILKDLSIGIQQRVLQAHISLSLAPMSRLAIVGPNGVGKTTLLKTMLGLLPCRSGSVHVAGKNIHQLSAPQRAQLITYVPQQSQLQFPVPVADVIAWARYAHGPLRLVNAESECLVEAAIEQFSLQELRDRPFNQLSGGEQRRVLLARAVASDAKIIVLDEPTAHLDMRHVLALQQSLLKLQEQGKTLLLVLHDLRDVEVFADSVLLMGEQQVHGPESIKHLIELGIVQEVYGVSINRREQYFFA